MKIKNLNIKNKAAVLTAGSNESSKWKLEP